MAWQMLRHARQTARGFVCGGQGYRTAGAAEGRSADSAGASGLAAVTPTAGHSLITTHLRSNARAILGRMSLDVTAGKAMGRLGRECGGSARARP
jgi:hypothetical protein